MFQMALIRSVLTKQCNPSNVFQSIRYFSSEIDFDNIVKKNKVVVFMKGTPSAPRCGFSNTVVQLLKLYKVEYDAHDVLSDENMRKGIKEYSSWPTIPQVFINGEFVGGSDILLQLHYSKKLGAELEKAGVKCEHQEKPQINKGQEKPEVNRGQEKKEMAEK